MTAAPFQELLQALGWRHALVIDPISCDGVVNIADRDHTTVLRDLVALQALRVACAIEALMMLCCRDNGELTYALGGSQNVS